MITRFARFGCRIICLFTLGLAACLDLQETPFIPFEANFHAPANVRIGEPVLLSPGETTVGAQDHQWYILELDTLVQAQQLNFSFDSVGRYTIRLISSAQKTVGLVRDSSERKILVLPVTDTLKLTQGFGKTEEDESLEDVLALPNDQGHVLLGRKQVNILEIIKLNNQGQEEWRTEFSNLAKGRIQGRNVILTRQGDLLIAGSIQAGAQEQDAFLIQLNIEEAQGRVSIQWQQIVSSIDNEFYTAVVEVTEQNCYYAVGTVSSSGQTSILIDRYSTLGELLSTQIFRDNCPSCSSQRAFLLEEGDEPRLVVAGQEIDNPAVFEFRLAEEGVTLQSKTVLTQIQGQTRRVLPLSDGKFALVGALNFGTLDSTHAFIAKLDVISQQVVPTWLSRLNFYQERLEDIQEDANGDLCVIGTHFNPLSGEDILFARFDTFSGALESARLLGSPNNEGATRFFSRDDAWVTFGYIENNKFFGFRDIQIAEISK